MVIRTRRQRILQVLGLYAMAAAAVAYFGFHAWHGDHGMKAKQQLLAEIAELGGQLERLRAERTEVERRVRLLRPEALDPDMLDQRARQMLNFTDPRELVLMTPGR